MPSNRKLSGMFRRYNRRYFGGKLPKAAVRYAALEDGDYGQIAGYDDGSFEISINPSYAHDLRVIGLTLFHEMVHLHLWPYLGHGRPFDAEMLRLAALGAFREMW